MTLRLGAKVLLHVWSYDFYDTTSYDKRVSNMPLFDSRVHVCVLFSSDNSYLKPFVGSHPIC